MKTTSWVRVAVALVVLGAQGRAQAEDPPAARPQPVLVAQLGHGNTVTSVACSSDGKWVATASYDRSVLVWERETGREIRRLKGHDSVVSSVAFSADGRFLLTASFDKTARLWERETGKEVRRYPGAGERLWSAAFSADGRFVVTAGDDKVARLFDRESGAEVRSFQGHGGPVTSASFSADGRFVLTSSHDMTARLWDRESGAEVKRFQGHTGPVASASFSADGRFVLTASNDKSARLWDRETGAEVKRYQGHTDRLTSAVLSADGRFALSAAWDSSARLWDRESGKELQRFAGHANFVSSVAFCPDGQVLTGSYDKSARLWDPAGGKEVRHFTGRADFVAGVAFSRDGRWCATAGEDGIARLWDRESGQQVRTFAGHTDRLTSLAFSPDARFVVTGSHDKTARLWDCETGKEARRYEGHTKEVASVAFAADGAHVLTGSEDQSARLWERDSGREVRRFEGHGARVASVALTADGRWVLTAGHDKTARCWDRAGGQEVRRYQGHTSMVSAVAVSADGRQVLTGAYDRSARLWDRETGQEVRRFEGHTGWLSAVAFAPNGRPLTGSLDGTARLWDPATGKEVRRYEGHTGWVAALAFSPDARWILTGGTDSTTRAWETESGRSLCSLISFRDGSWAVVDSDGRYDASAQGRVLGLHWIVGQEAVALEQLQSAYFEPGLLGKVLRPPGSPPVARLDVPDFRRIGLFPKVHVEPPGPDGTLKIDLENRGGGIGRVVVKIDGATVAEVRSSIGAPADAPRESIAVPLADNPRLAKGRSNRISVEVYNAEGSLRSRGLALDYTAPGTAAVRAPEFWAVVVGVSRYAGESLTLKYAAKDAEDFAGALAAAATSLFGAERMHLTLLTTSPPRAPPTRTNVKQALDDARRAGADDVFVLYLAGHGVTHGTPPDYYFLTQEAASTDASLEDVRKERAVSAKEIEEALRSIPARKRILVFDTCRAGSAAANLTGRGDDPGEQTRVMARVRQAMGTYVLAGCAADRVSYEASRYAQGLLTYALLEGMKTGAAGAVREGDLLEAGGLLGYAMRRVPQIAKGVGGIQDPQLTIPDQATPIDLGRVTAGVRAGIRLAGERPLFGLPDVQLSGDVPGDPQGLATAVQQALTSAAEAREGPTVTYVPTHEGAGLIRIAGRYSVSGDQVKVRVYLRRLGDGAPQDIGNFEVEGRTGALPDLARRLVAQAAALAKPK